MLTLPLGILLIAGCLLAQGFFSGSEMALVSANRDKLRALAETGNVGAGHALALLDREERLLGTCLIGTNTCLVTAGTLVAALVAAQGLRPEVWATALLTPIALTFGEAVPKTVYRHHADTLAPMVARPLRVFEQVLFRPMLWLVDGWSAVLKRLPGEARNVSRAGIVGLLDDGHGGGDIDPGDRELIKRLFGLVDTPVESCMTPLVDVIALPETATVADATSRVLQHGKSRLMVYRDRIDNIIGYIDHRDLLFSATGDAQPVSAIARPARYVPETQRSHDLLRQLRNEQEHLAVVVDEYGGAVGLVTVEDLLEEVVGEIRDERDKAGPGIRRLSERDWRVPARLEIGEVSEVIGRPLPEGDYETVAGMVLARLGRIPEAGEVVRVGGFTIHVEAATDRAIQTVRLTAPRSVDV